MKISNDVLSALLNQVSNFNLDVLLYLHDIHLHDSIDLKLVLTSRSVYEVALNLNYFLRTKGLILSFRLLKHSLLLEN